MKRFVCLILTLVLCTGCLMMAGASEIATNGGLRVLSPEQYLGIDPCSYVDVCKRKADNWYSYNYSGRGLKYKDKGNNADWRRMEDYVEALVDSGYYKIIDHEKKEEGSEEYWRLSYTGSKNVGKIKLGYVVDYEWNDIAIEIESYVGSFTVYYSMDIITDDLDETQKRTGRDIGISEEDIDDSTIETNDNNNKNTNKDNRENRNDSYDTKTRCSFCGGDGKRDCTGCSGKGYNTCGGCNGSGDRRCGSCYGTGTHGSKRCSTCFGSGERTCSSCGGSGKRDCSSCSGGSKSCSSCGGDGWR